MFSVDATEQVSSTTPPSDNAAPASPMAELDSKAVDNMIAESGLNEVTLKVISSCQFCVTVLEN